MKGDFSRQTFDRKKHYSGVKMQQGRVQLDADWNEQSDIINYRAEITALDIIGGCGGPLHNAGFGVVLPGKGGEAERAIDKNKLRSLALRKGDFGLSAGRYYVDGILCENEQEIAFSAQPDLPGVAIFGATGGLHLLYLDVWQRHLTALDDPRIREIALGGPDTATRVRTISQAKLWPVPDKVGNCITAFAAFKKFISRTEGTLNAGTASEKASDDPCIVPPSAGFRGLENQFYRVEIHDGGAALNVSGAPAGEKITEISGSNEAKMSGGGTAWEVGKAVEIYPTKAGSDQLGGTLAYVTKYDKASDTLTFDTTLSGIDSDDDPFVRPVSTTFKWSRDNGIVVSLIEKIDAANKKITVQSVGPDETLGFSVGQWVEISDDAKELNGQPGQLAQIADVNSTTREITLKSTPAKLATGASGVNAARNPKLRRWDGVGAVKFSSTNPAANWLGLEDGVQVQFDGNGEYRTGDFWTIAARTATADVESGHIEWPVDSARRPVAQAPFGIKHHYCPLALINWDARNGVMTADDCRSLFPPITELIALHYVSGDGQEVMPTLAAPKPDFAPPLLHPLVVGVSNGQHPVAGAKVRFDAKSGNGKIFPDATAVNEGRGLQVDADTVIVRTDNRGLAACEWHLANTGLTSQQVEATLLNVNDQPVHLPVRFNGNLSVASEVAYQPGECDKLDGVLTVQAALDQLCQLIGINDEPGIHVKSVFTIDDTASDQPFRPLENDSDVDFAALAAGIMIQCDQPLFIDSLRDKPTCFVTLEMPYPFNSVDRQMWSSGEGSNPDAGFPIIGFNPLILDGETMFAGKDAAGGVIKADPTQITWRPTFGTAHWLRTQLFDMIRELGRFSETRQGRVLAHLTLKGNFIWSEKDPDLYLDGQAFGVRDDKEARTDLALPSGDGKRGGDFEMWFWLVTFQLQVDPGAVNIGAEATGTVNLLSGNAPKGGARILLESTNPNVAEPKAKSVTIPAGQKTVQFPIVTKTAGQVVIRARYAGGTQTDTLNVLADTIKVKGVRILRTNGVPNVPNPVELAKMTNPKTTLEVNASDLPDVVEVEFTLPPNSTTITPTSTFTVTPEFSSPPTPLPGKMIFGTNKNVVRWTRAQTPGNLTPGTYIVTLVGNGQPAITTDLGTRLDGEPAQLPSGDGNPGGNFTFKLNVRASTPQPLQALPLKVGNARILRVKNLTDTSPLVVFDMKQQMPPGGVVRGIDAAFNAIEVTFTGASVNRETAISGLTFVVSRETFVNNLTTEVMTGDIVETTPNVLRWVFNKGAVPGGTPGAVLPFNPQDVYRVKLFGNPNPSVPSTGVTIMSKDGRRLDGEPSKLPSGNDTDGGDFFFEIRRSVS